MTYDLDDWWQTPLGDKGMELRDLIKETLTVLMNKLKKEKILDETARKSFKQVMNFVDAEYMKLTEG
jgi:hypothetical protein